jgi:Rieske 2Fe-2S family protein
MRSTDRLTPTLGTDDYCSTRVFDVERERIFHRGWFFVAHASTVPEGHRIVVDVAGESVIVSRDLEGDLHAHANVCRHRGSQLCEGTGNVTRGSIRCPYHYWKYGLDGSLLATPRVYDDFDRRELSLWRHHAAEWNGMMFVSLAAEPTGLEAWLREHTPELFQFTDLPIGEYRVGARTESEVPANWKILLENYQECLHCAVVHPELVEVIPLYRSGAVVDPDRPDGSVELVAGGDSFTGDGRSDLALLPGIAGDRINSYNGAAVFPNLMVDITGTSMSLTALFPSGPDRTVVVAEYLFSADDVARPDFDPSTIVDFNELVGRQDYDVCTGVQRGVASSAFTSGVLTSKDALVADFVRHYLDTRGPVD